MSATHNVNAARPGPYSVPNRRRFRISDAVNLVKSVVPAWLTRFWQKEEAEKPKVERKRITKSDLEVDEDNVKPLFPTPQPFSELDSIKSSKTWNTTAINGQSEELFKPAINETSSSSSSHHDGEVSKFARADVEMESEVKAGRKRQHSQNDDDSTSGISSTNEVDMAAALNFDSPKASRFSQFLASSNAPSYRLSTSPPSISSTWSQSKRARYLELAPVSLRTPAIDGCLLDGQSSGTTTPLFSPRFRHALSIASDRYSAMSSSTLTADARCGPMLDAHLAAAFGRQSVATSTTSTLANRKWARPAFDPEAASTDYLTPLLNATQSNANSIMIKSAASKSGSSALFYSANDSRSFSISPLVRESNVPSAPSASRAFTSPSGGRRFDTTACSSSVSNQLINTQHNEGCFSNRTEVRSPSAATRSTARIMLDRLSELDVARRQQPPSTNGNTSPFDRSLLTFRQNNATSPIRRGIGTSSVVPFKKPNSVEPAWQKSVELNLPISAEQSSTSFGRLNSSSQVHEFSFSSPIPCAHETSSALAVSSNSSSSALRPNNSSTSPFGFGVPRKSNTAEVGFAFSFAPPLELATNVVNQRSEPAPCT